MVYPNQRAYYINVWQSGISQPESILYKRLAKLYIPTREQAGCQKGRSCIEHIMTIQHLLTRGKLIEEFEELKKLGCGQIMLKIIIAAYRKTTFLFRNAMINSNMGVKQGSSTSCFLFILYVDRMVKMIKQSFKDDGFLGGLHILMLMDDTVLLSTTREGIIEKFRRCQDFCKEYFSGWQDLKGVHFKRSQRKQ